MNVWTVQNWLAYVVFGILLVAIVSCGQLTASCELKLCEPILYSIDACFMIQEKEDWINAIGRSIVRHSRSVTDDEILDYDSKGAS